MKIHFDDFDELANGPRQNPPNWNGLILSALFFIILIAYLFS
jgi:hypothetical protein